MANELNFSLHKSETVLGGGIELIRVKVEGGWLYRSKFCDSIAMAFVPDAPSTHVDQTPSTPSKEQWMLQKQGQLLSSISADGRVSYRGQPMSNEDLGCAIKLWLTARSEI